LQPKATHQTSVSRLDETKEIGDSLDRQLGQVLEPVRRQALVEFLRVLRAWNHVHNLTAIHDLDEQVRRHLVESVLTFRQFPPDLQRASSDRPLRVMDVGSGAGVPAIAWAILAGPSFHMTLVEKVGKKAAFLRRVVHQLELGSRVAVIEDDVRQVKPLEPYQMVSSRAFASLGDFINWTHHLLVPSGMWLYLAGQLNRITGLSEHGYCHADPSLGVRLFNITPVYLPGQEASHLVWLSKEGFAC
jgi:16S rRNA (guanine527-N7)-methyltransferase